MLNIWGGHITRATDEIKNFNTNELKIKLLNSVLSYNELETRVLEFNKTYPEITFDNSISFELVKALVNQKSPRARMQWEESMKIPWILIEAQDEPYSLKTEDILAEYIRLESKRSMKRIIAKRDVITPDGKTIRDLLTYDYSIVDSYNQFENYRSIYFEKNNCDIIKHYYQTYLYYFPVTLAEFERIFFFFLTFITTKQYSDYNELKDIKGLIKEINDILRMRYIDINNKLLLSLISLTNIDLELLYSCMNINQEIKEIDELITLQIFGRG